MKIIFLDIDGVLNLFPKKEKELQLEQKLDKECVKNLQRIIKETGAKVVLSSTRRLHPKLIENFVKQTDITLYGITGRDVRGRGMEINSFLLDTIKLRDYEDVGFVIIDDDISDIVSVFLKERIIKTDTSIGLTKEQTDLAIKILSGNSDKY